jgi:cytochrome c556
VAHFLPFDYRFSLTHMKIRLFTVTLITAFAAALFVQAQPPAGGQQKEPETELGKKMEAINKAYGTLRRQVADATKNEDSLKQIATIRENAEASLKLQPKKTDTVAADEKAKFVSGYQAQMKKFIADLDKVEAAIKAGNNSEANTLMATLKQDQSDGHNEYRKMPKKA